MRSPDLTAERVRALFHYDLITGVLTRRETVSSRAIAGMRAGGPRRDGYRHISIDGRRHLEHRVVWLHVHGKLPAAFLDHVNGMRSDNRICNLREVSPQENTQNNTVIRSDNQSAFHIGVSWHKKNKRWRARIGAAGKKIELGWFETAEQARDAYLKAKSALHISGALTTHIKQR